MNNVVEWSNTTVIELMRLSWPVVGYEVDHDGTPNPALPIRRCPSCRVYADTTGSPSDWQHRHDCTLTAILRRYSEGILSNLHLLVQHVHGKNAYEQASRGVRSSRPELAPASSHDVGLRRGTSGSVPAASVTRQGSVEDLIAIMGPPPDSQFLSGRLARVLVSVMRLGSSVGVARVETLQMTKFLVGAAKSSCPGPRNGQKLTVVLVMTRPGCCQVGQLVPSPPLLLPSPLAVSVKCFQISHALSH
jgi:hypothetical protein